jgi:hypothetical protein
VPGDAVSSFAVAAVEAFLIAALDGQLGLASMFDAFNFKWALSELDAAVSELNVLLLDDLGFPDADSS